MSPEELKQLDREICNRWPKKFNAADLNYWRNQMCDYVLADVVEALTKFRNTSAFRPKPPEIIKLMPRRPGQDLQAPERPFAEIVRGQMGISKERSGREVLMRYWRSVWWQYKLNADLRREAMELSVKVSAERQQVPEADVRSKPAFVEMVETHDRQREGMLQKCLRGCVCSLVNEGLTPKEAADYADWIETHPDAFKGFLSDLRSMEVVDVLA